MMSHPQGLLVPENVAVGGRPTGIWPDWAVRNLRLLALACLMFVLSGVATVAAPSVTNVKFVQQPGTKLVSVTYDLAGGTCSVSLLVSNDNGATYNVPVKSVTGAVGNGVTSGTGKRIIWDAGTDWAGQHSNQIKMRVRAWDMSSDAGMTFALIPGGTYQMGNLNGDGDIIEAGTVSVTLSPYYMAIHPTTKAQWDAVRTWAVTNGYTDLAAGAGKASNHPVQTVSWYSVVKWSNAASEMEGLTPCYKVSGTIYRTGINSALTCDWNANGYRLPTEAEWEIAARGGLSKKRFPWGDTISHSQANYRASSTLAYDLSGSVNDNHPTYKTGATPYTSPVGSFAANGYGLYDIAGNVGQWCWDWLSYSYTGGVDPRGDATGLHRVIRGWSWNNDAATARCAARSSYPHPRGPTNDPINSYNVNGFRLARGRL
jgi:formylglycine-generating enzyme